MPACREPIADATLVEYWAGDLAAGDEINRLEEHLFACGDCCDRLAQLAALGAGVATLARQGRIRGVVSRAIVNRLQREGVHVRMFALAPGEVVPCAVFPGDDLVVTSLRADFSGVEAVTISVTGPGSAPFSHFEDVPVSADHAEVFWATPARLVQQLPSVRLEITVTATGSSRTELGRYVLEHSAQP